MQARDITVLHVTGSPSRGMSVGLKYDGVLYTYQDFKIEGGRLTFALEYLPPDGEDQLSADAYERIAAQALEIVMSDQGAR